jgi:GNAT superfamily N-acetyltransferase
VVSHQFSLRTAKPPDAEAIARLVNVAFRSERFIIDQDRTCPAKVRVLLEQGEFLLTEESGVLAGCIYIERRGERGYFGLLAVDPEKQGSGIGSALIQAAERHCRAAGCRLMDLTIVNLREELCGFYRARGYVETGIEPFPEAARAPMPCHLIRLTKRLA